MCVTDSPITTILICVFCLYEDTFGFVSSYIRSSPQVIMKKCKEDTVTLLNVLLLVTDEMSLDDKLVWLQISIGFAKDLAFLET